MEDDEVIESGVETEEVEEPEFEAPEEEAEEGDEESGEETEGDEPEEFEEVNFGGDKFTFKKGEIPEELANRLKEFTSGTWSEYTKKSQAVAEQAKAIEARASAIEKLESLQGTALETYSQGLKIKAELSQLQQIDVNALWQSNPDQARRVSDAISQKQRELQQVAQKVAQQEQEFATTREAEMSRMVEEGKKKVTAAIRTFETDAPAVIDYAVKHYGVSPDEAKNWPANPVAAQMAWKAWKFDQMQAKAATASRKPVAAKPVQSKAKGGGKTTATRDPAKMTVDEMAKFLR